MNLNSKGPLILLTRYQTPARLRRAGHKRIAAYLRNRGVKGSSSVAQKALNAAKAHSVSLPTQDVASRIVAQLADLDVLGLKERINTLDERIYRSVFSPVRRLGFSLACQVWGRSSGPSFWWPSATSAPSLALTGSPPTRVSFRWPVTPANGLATTAGCEEGIRLSSGCSTSRPLPACEAPRSPGPSKIARGVRARDTPRRWLRSPAGGTTSCGR